MRLDEAIAHAREKAKEIRESIIDGNNLEPYELYCNAMTEQCAKKHEQLAEWLEELKELRNMTAGHLYAVAFNRGYLKAEKEVREKTIDDFARKLITHFADWELSNTPCNDDETDRTKEIICETIENAIGGVEEIAEQLKAGEDNESKQFNDKTAQFEIT